MVTSINGMILDCETLGDTFPKSIIKNEFPYRDKSLLDDMGLQTRTVKIRCYFYNDTYEDHKKLLNLLYGQQSFELQHEVYGLLHGSISNIDVKHNDRQKTAEIDFEFVEGVTGVEPTIIRDVESETEDLYEQGLNEAEDSFIEEFEDDLGAEAPGILDKVLDPEKSILEQFEGISETAREYVKKVDNAVSKFEATLQTITTPANALISTIDFAAKLPGRVIGSVAHVVDRYSRLYQSLKSAPNRFIQSFKDGIRELENSMFSDQLRGGIFSSRNVWKTFKRVSALEAGLQTGIGFGLDEETRKKQKRDEGLKRFDIMGNYIPRPVEKVMNIREIEQTLYTAREMIQESIDISRNNQVLKNLAELLLYHVNVIKLEREKIIQVQIDNEIPLHLICLSHGLSYMAAERILAINNIKNPNFTVGEISNYAR
jgi:prophage DNA circulation protein